MVNIISPLAKRAKSSRRDSASFCRSGGGQHENKCSGGSHGDESGISVKEPAKLSLKGPLAEDEES